MRSIHKCARWLFSLTLFLAVPMFLMPPALAQQDAPPTTRDPLASILLAKGILTPAEMKQIEGAPTRQQAEERMAHILLDKGLISKADYELVAGKAQEPKPVISASAAPAVQAPATAQAPKPQAQALIAAVAPIRALPVGGVSREAIVPAFKVGGVGILPYGALKATLVEDSSSPNGDDFPLPGFLCDTGPDGSPEFHIKARSSKVGANFVWYDASPKWSISGKIELDFEGNFNRSDNRNISTIRSSNPSLRLAWGRVDYTATPKNIFSALFGQDWTLFGSSTLPSVLETTGMGIGFGTLYERSPQMRVGYTHKAARFQIMLEFGVTLPAVGLPPSAANISQQLAYGERQGADSNRPDVEGRLVGQWQLDHAAGVAPAQIIVSAEHGNRTAIVLAAAIPTAYEKTFSKGAAASSHTDGWDFEWQLPTRYATLIGKFYSGADLRYFFVNQLYSYFNDTTGLTSLASLTSEDGSSAVILGTNASGQQVVAPQRPIRTEGGFAQLGLPLSRIFNARADGAECRLVFECALQH